jgi:protoporphyrinogen IX oxidase
MSEFLTQAYLWIKAMHVIAAISWMVGLLYLPRLFVYHAQHGEPGTDVSETFKVMERRLLKYIMNPAMVATWLFGLVLVLTPGMVDLSTVWFGAKFAAVLALTACHLWLAARRREFLADSNTRPARTYRLVNEVPTLMMIVIVIMVIVRPFS